MEQLIRILIERLTRKGIEVTSIPAYIRNFANTIVTHPSISLEELNDHLQLLGWDEFALDNDIFYLMLATLEPDLAYDPDYWVNRSYNSNGLPQRAAKKELGSSFEKDKDKLLQE
ncbi:MAG: hypothetical protein JSW12_04970 [Deltaproteobacteria bacterium]|nr:MAG: hypothetical protein JSW12_04970 [Deltaproteobacteria bacterium]